MTTINAIPSVSGESHFLVLGLQYRILVGGSQCNLYMSCLLYHLCVLPGGLVVVLWVSLFTHTDPSLTDSCPQASAAVLTGDSGLPVPLHRAVLIPDFACVLLVLTVAVICVLCDKVGALYCFIPTAVQRHRFRLRGQNLRLSIEWSSISCSLGVMTDVGCTEFYTERYL